MTTTLPKVSAGAASAQPVSPHGAKIPEPIDPEEEKKAAEVDDDDHIFDDILKIFEKRD